MLEQMRERAGRWVVGFILALLILSFSLWGVGSYFQGPGATAVARVGDEDITPAQLQRAIAQETDRVREALGERYRPGMLNAELLRDQALRGEIDRRLVEHNARDRGLVVADSALAAFITGNEAFQGEGGFDRERYAQLLRARGMSVSGFEAQVRAGLLTEQVDRGLVQSAEVSPAEALTLARIWFETRDLRVAVIERAALPAPPPPTEDAIRAYYDAHAAQFRTPEQLTVAYLLLDPDAIEAEVEISEDEAHARYESDRARYSQPERRRVRHILVRVAPDADKAAIAQAREQAEALAARLAQGAEFAALAREHSDDAGSARQGGLLGTFPRGTLDPAVDEAAFALAPDTVSEPVRTGFGWHLVRVDRVDGGTVTPFEQVRDEIIATLRAERVQELTRTRLEDLGRLAFEHPDSLEPAAQATGLSIQQVGPFPATGGPGPAGNPAFATAAFSAPVLEDGVNSEPVDLGEGRYAVLRATDRQASAAIPFDQARADIAARLTREAATTAARDHGRALVEKLNAGAAADTLPTPQPQWRTVAGVPREGRSGLPGEVVERAFAQPRPGGVPTPQHAGVELSSGDYAIVAVTAVHTPGLAVDSPQVMQLREALTGLRRQTTLASYLEVLRTDVPVRVYQQPGS